MVNYKELGLVNTREMFKKAIAGVYAIPAFNFNNMERRLCYPRVQLQQHGAASGYHQSCSH